MKTRWTTIAGIVTLLLLPPSSLAARHIQITACPYTANVAGAIYTVVNNIGDHGGCIDVAAPRITVKINGKIVGGGVVIEPVARRAHILGPGTIWDTLVDEGDSALIEGLVLQGGGGSGLVLRGVSGTIVERNKVYGADGIDFRGSQKCKINHNKVRATSGGQYSPAYDIWIEAATVKGQSKDNVISNNNLAGKGGLDGASMGILVGDSLDAYGNCPAGRYPIEGTVIMNNNASNHSGWDVPGIGISLGCNGDSAHSVIKHNTALHNQNYDLYDGNPDCGTNTWEDNHFKTSNQSCIK